MKAKAQTLDALKVPTAFFASFAPSRRRDPWHLHFLLSHARSAIRQSGNGEGGEIYQRVGENWVEVYPNDRREQPAPAPTEQAHVDVPVNVALPPQGEIQVAQPKVER